MQNNKEWFVKNQAHWEEITPLHVQSNYYDVEGFKAGASTLRSLDLQEVGDVTGKNLLHLQCSFGLDTLSWARQGATVTGVDFAENAIEYAEALSQRLSIPARFIDSNVYDLPEKLSEQFDIVYTSEGVLRWLPDLQRWAQVINHFLKPNGFVYVRDNHPLADVFSRKFQLVRSYFHSDMPRENISEGTYADRTAHVESPSYEWQHSLSDTVNALICEGLKLEYIHEFPFMDWERFNGLMEQNAEGWYQFKDKDVSLPLMFSIKASK